MSHPKSENEENTSCILTSENFCQNWQNLGNLNIPSILPENFQKTINYWSFLASKIIKTIPSSSNLSISNVIQIMKVCRISVLLTQKSFQNGEKCNNPISFLSELSKPLSTPDQIVFPLLKQPNISESIYYFCEICKHLLKTDFTVELVVNCSIYLSMKELNFSEDPALFDYFNNIYRCSSTIPDNEIQNILNFNDIKSLLESLRRIRLKMNQPNFYVLQYLFEKIFDYKFKYNYIQNNFYQNLITKGLPENDAETILLTCFNYIRGDPVQFEPSKFSKNPIFFILLCLNNLISKDSKEIFYSKFANEFDPWIFIAYSYYINIYTNNFANDFLNFLHIKELNEQWSSALIYVIQSKNIQTNLERENLYIKNIKALFLLSDNQKENQNKEKANDSNERPKQSPPIPEKINDDLMTPTLFWYNYNKIPLKIEVVTNLLNKLNSYFQDCLKKTFSDHPLFIHSESLEFHCSYYPAFIPPVLPSKPEDFLTASPPLPPLNCYTIINLILYQLIEISIQFKYDLPLNSLTSFCCNYYISVEIKDKIFSLYDTALNEKAIESNLFHLDSIFNEPDSNPDKYKCIQLISPILSILPFSYDFIIRILQSNEKYLPIINQIFENSSFLKGIDSLEQNKIQKMLDVSIERNFQNIAKLIITNISDINITSSLITSIVFTKPSIALFLYKSISNKINPSKIISLMSDQSVSLFPSEVPILSDLINFLITISESLDHIPFTYHLIAKSKQLPTTWEEDFASKSTEVLTKAFINIWAFPPMSKSDIQKETQKLLSIDNSHEKENDECCCLKGNNIFDHYCCSYKKGQINQPTFFCYTCGVVDRYVCCLGCAMTCHRGHDIVFARNDECQCDCYRIPNMCIFNPKQENLYNNEDIAAPNIEMTLEHLHNLIDEGGNISFQQRQFLSALFNNERMPEIQVTKPYLGENGEYEGHHKKRRTNIEQQTLQIDRNNDSSNTQTEKSDTDISRSTKISPLNQKSLLNLFLKVASIQFDKQEENNLNNNIDVEIDLGWQDVVYVNKAFNSIPIEDLSSQSLINWNEMQKSFTEYDAITFIIQRCIISPLNIATFVSNNILVLSTGKSIISYRLPSFDQKLSSINISGFVTQISPSKSNPDLIIVSTLFQVYLVKVDNEGNFEMINDKIIKYQKIGPEPDNNDSYDEKSLNSFSLVLNAFWLNSKDIKIAILFRGRMMFYNLSDNDNQEAYMTLIPSGSDSFRSAVIVENNGEDFAIITTESGKYIVYPCSSSNSSENDNPIVASKMNSFPWLPEKPIISYCSTTNLFFVTSSGDEIACIKKDDFFLEKPLKPFMVNTFGAPDNLIFIGNHPKNPNFYFFFHVMSSSVVTMEIGRSKVIFSLNENRFEGYRFPALTKETSPLTFFKGPSLKDEKEEVFYSISMNGQLNEFELLSSMNSNSKRKRKNNSTIVKPSLPKPPIPLAQPPHRPFHHQNENNNRNSDSDANEPLSSRYHDIFLRSMRSMLEDNDRNDDSEIDPLDMDPQIKVPPIFWSKSRLSLDDNIQIFIPNFEREARIILQNEKIIFNNSIRNKFIEVCCLSETDVIIGFRFFVSNNSSSNHRPPYLSLNGRVTKVDDARWYMLPLAADEIEPRKVYRVELGNRGGYDINCDGFGVFVIDRSLIEDSISLQSHKLELNLGSSSEHGNEWFFESSSLLSFDDSSSSYGIRKKKTKNDNNNNNEEEEEIEIDTNDQNLKKSLSQLSFLFSPMNSQSDNSLTTASNNANNDNENSSTTENTINNNNNNNDSTTENNNNNNNSGCGCCDDDAVVSFDDESIKNLVKLIYTNSIASIPARRILLRMIFANSKDEENENQNEDASDSDEKLLKDNQKVINIWSDVMKSLLKEKKVLPELWDVFLRDYSLMPKEEQSQISELLWENNPPTGNEFAFFSAFVS
ncbi:hypothetical protein M9Y10_008556 [Tritrichomonas musculus]|uniref:UBR-type domain-containing protein n=1 Tax=Tritrichomonas musculus TaxID=1915356 RepID=A0ABR2IYQ0_9EUKA